MIPLSKVSKLKRSLLSMKEVNLLICCFIVELDRGIILVRGRRGKLRCLSTLPKRYKIVIVL